LKLCSLFILLFQSSTKEKVDVMVVTGELAIQDSRFITSRKIVKSALSQLTTNGKVGIGLVKSLGEELRTALWPKPYWWVIQKTRGFERPYHKFRLHAMNGEFVQTNVLEYCPRFMNGFGESRMQI
jgi:hypothetical protein